MMIILCQWVFNEQIEKLVNIVTLYQQELFKKIPRLGKFCTQSANEGLSTGAAPQDNIIPQNVSNYLTVNTVKHPRRLNLIQ